MYVVREGGPPVPVESITGRVAQVVGAGFKIDTACKDWAMLLCA